MADSTLEQLAKTDRNPIQEKQYQDLLTASGMPFTISNGRASVDGFGTGGNGTDTMSFNYAGNNAQQQQIFKNAIAPAVNSLEASRPEVNTAFDTRAAQVEAGRTPLMDRYKKLIDDIRGQGASQQTDTQRVLSQELGRRGITGDSTFAEEENLRRIQPIQQATESNVVNTTLDREEKLRSLDDTITNLTQEKIAAQRDITNAIAQIQASSGQAAAAAALEQFKAQQAIKQQELDRAVAEKNAETARITANAAATKTDYTAYKEIQGGLYDVANNRWVVPPKATGTGTGNIIFPTVSTTSSTTTPFDYTANKPNLNTSNPLAAQTPQAVQNLINQNNVNKSLSETGLSGLNLSLNGGQARY